MRGTKCTCTRARNAQAHIKHTRCMREYVSSRAPNRMAHQAQKVCACTQSPQSMLVTHQAHVEVIALHTTSIRNAHCAHQVYKGHTCTACARALQAREACVHIESTRWACTLNALQCTTRARVSPRQLHKAVACTPSRNAGLVHIKRTTRAGTSNHESVKRTKCSCISSASTVRAHQAHRVRVGHHAMKRTCVHTRRIDLPCASSAIKYTCTSPRVSVRI